MLLDLLFELATWHGLAKLQMHTETTLRFLDTSTTHLGKYLRRFMSETRKHYVTRDLPSEEAAQGRRQARDAAKDSGTARPVSHGPKVRYFNFQTYKLHALRDYVAAIRRFGTTDNNSTQLVSRHFESRESGLVINVSLQGELEHRRVKRFYPRVSKAKFTSGIAKQQRRERILFRMSEQELPTKSLKRGKGQVIARHSSSADDSPMVPFEESEPLAYSDPNTHYHIATSTRYFLNLPQWLSKHAGDAALQVV